MRTGMLLRAWVAVVAALVCAGATLALATAGSLLSEARATSARVAGAERDAAIFDARTVMALNGGPDAAAPAEREFVLVRLAQADTAVRAIVSGRVSHRPLVAPLAPRLARALRLQSYAPSADEAFRVYAARANALFQARSGGTPPSAEELGGLRAAADAVFQVLGYASEDVRRVERRSLLFMQSVGIGGVVCGFLGGMVALSGRRRRPVTPAVAAVPNADVVLSLNADNTVARASGAVQRVLGIDPANLDGAAVTAVANDADGPALERWLDDTRRGVQRLDKLILRPRGRQDIVCEVDRFGNRRRDDLTDGRIELRVRDITTQQRAEEMLRQSSEMLRTLTEASPLAITVEDLDGRVQFWNAASHRMFGWAPGDVIGQANPTVPEAAADARGATCRRIREGQTFAIMEDRRTAQDSRVVDVVISAAPLRDGSGAVSGILEVITDVTERKQLQAQLLQAQKMEGIGRLAGGIAHDFNNLLTAILGHAALVRQVCAPGAAAPRADLVVAVEQIQTAAERAAQMTQQLLAFSRNQLMQPTLMDLNAAVREMEGIIQPLIGAEIDLVTVAAPDLPCVKADPAQMTQVLVNLVLNARDAMPSGGKLTIEMCVVELDEEYGRRRMAVIPGEYVMLAVSDNGSGMDQETLSHIFEPFFSTKARDKGTGLGLATVYGIVKQTGGYIWCYSEPNVGTTFKIYLPSVRVPAERRAAERMTAPVRRGSETVLLVEDEEMVRSLVKQVLTWYGYTVLEAHNGEMALQLARQHDGPIALLLTDLIMPGLAAVELVQQLSPERPEMRVLYMSGYTDHAVVRHQLLNADVPFLQKPFAPDRLAHKVAEVLKGRADATEPGRVSVPAAGLIATQ